MILNDFNFGSTRLARFELPVIIERIISTYMSVKLQTIYKETNHTLRYPYNYFAQVSYIEQTRSKHNPTKN